MKKDIDKAKSEGSNFMSDDSGKPMTLDAKKIKLLEDERNKLKKEIDDIWKALEEKENVIQQQQNEIKKMSELKKTVDKYKVDKGALNDEIKRFTAQVNSLNASLNEARAERDEDKMKYEKLLKDSELKNLEKMNNMNNQTMIKDLVEDTKKSINQMQKKIDFYREKSENLEGLQVKLADKEKEVFKLKAEHSTEQSNLRTRITEEFEEKIETLDNKYNNELKAIQERHFNEMKSFDGKLTELRHQGRTAETNDFYIETLKQQKEVVDKMAMDLKTQLLDLQNITKADKMTIKELKDQLEDYKMRCELQKKTYKKP